MSQSNAQIKGMKLLSTLISNDAHWKIKILNRWTTIAENFAKHVSIKTIDDTSITLQTTHPMWAQEVRGNIQELLEKIQKVCGHNRITKIIVLGSKALKSSRNADSGKTHLVQRTLFASPSLEFTQPERDALISVRHKKLATSMAEFYLQCKRRALLVRQQICEQGTPYESCSHSPLCSTRRPTPRSFTSKK